MFMMTAKVDIKKILVVLAAVAGIILALVILLGGKNSEPTAAPAVSDNASRIAFLKNHGWEVQTSPTESGQVRIPKNPSEVYERYNALQKSQGYDLTEYAGKTVMRYVYKVTNFPGATEPVYATILVYKNQIIGGDITDTAPTGVVRGFARPQQELTTESSVPTEE